MQKDNIFISVNNERYDTLINQTGVKHHLLPSPSNHNASWDALLTSTQEVYLSLCSELTTSEYAKLVKLNKETGDFESCFYTKDTVFTNYRHIRDSKIHTSMTEMDDGRIIMCTHTTDKAPEHPAWLPHAFYNNPWTGYAGSHMMIYDPSTKTVEALGIPVNRETLYGGVYSKKTGCFYALGFLKGHLYGINPKTKEVKDYGQVVERASYRLLEGLDGNIYFTSRNGVLLKLDIRKDVVVNLKHQLPFDERLNKKRGYACYMVNGPDGKIYIATMFTDKISTYDPTTDTFEVIGRYKEEDYYTDSSAGFDHVGAMGFDKYGMLYLAVCPIRYDGKENFKMGSSLIQWDVLNHKEPVFLGILGTESKAVVTTCSMLMDHDHDMMYIVQTNHGNDAPDVLEIALSAYRKNAHITGPKCLDPFIQPSNNLYKEHNESITKTLHTWNINPYQALKDKCIAIPLWQDLELDPGRVSITSIRNENTVHVELSDGQYAIYTYEGVLVEKGIRTDFPLHDRVASVDGFKLPFSYPGRQYLSTKRDIITLRSGDRVMVTNDGLLVVEFKQTKQLRNYGPIWVNAPLISWTRLNRRDVIYGIAGDKDDFSCLFRFTIETGIEWLGYLGHEDKNGSYNSPYGGSISVDSRDTYLVVASKTTLPTVYVYQIGGNYAKDK